MAEDNLNQEDATPEVDFLSLSDEELAKMDFPGEESGDPSAEPEPEPEESEAPAGDDAGEEESDEETDDPSPDEGDPVEGAAPEEGESPAEEDAPTEETPVENPGEDKDEFFRQITAPFKANGHEMQVRNADEAVRLMKMGANYNKKMSALKPNLKMMRMLQDNDLLDESKLGYLVDLHKRNPEAIAKLVKDAGIDPMDIDTEKDSGYKPTTYTVDEKQMALEEVAEQLQETPTYDKLLDVVVNKWDSSSQGIIRDNPQVLHSINSQIASGVYDLIATEIARERALGRFVGLSDIDAYRQVGDAIDARGGFNHLFPEQAPAAPNGKKVAAQPQQTVTDSGRNNRRRAASPTKHSGNAAKNLGDFNPLAMSDEEFAKLDPNFL